ncbi:LysR family transcriptional regulator [Gordonia polyisoprenivorans]|uniref:LysR family transcriptional regulator n=1 Tax=Gordonia polyisoprenivorans TaxID=84595 RepID=UPI00223425D6|nr:LysR family transcriptional regulator [uncultured Gordonia sp.]UZF56278.1 LysR family transcriptional regulator [Gordonia polyisoprenivorans]
MEWDLRELRFFVTAADAGSFTEAAERLYVSQAAVSRTIASLERSVGETLLRRIPRGCELTSTGRQVLPHARRVLAEAQRFTQFLDSRHAVLRLGYAWAALGKHTTTLQREWARQHENTELELVRHNSATGGLADGLCDVAIVRVPVDEKRFGSAIVGLERRLVAFATDDPQWARRRSLTMAEVATRPVLVDTRSGTTHRELWAGTAHSPEVVEIHDVEGWLDAIAAGRGVGTTAESTAHHHARGDITYRPVKDGPRIAVRLAWWLDHEPAALGDLITTTTRLYST